MRRLVSASLAAMLAAGPALAQVASPAPQAPHPDRPSRHNPFQKPPPKPTSRVPVDEQGRPLDVGPFTPEASKAYMGGGVILQGAPGEPAPTPEATPPGQMPRNMVPMK